MTLAITLSLWRAEHISQARCVTAGPRARAEPPRAQPGADGGSRQPGTGTRPGRRMRAGREVAGGGGIRLWGEGEMPGEKPKQTLLLPALRGAPRDASQGPLVATVSGGGLLFPWTPLQGSCRDVGASAQATAGSSLPQCARRGPRCLGDARRPASRTPPHSSGTWSRGPGKARSLSAPIALFK